MAIKFGMPSLGHTMEKGKVIEWLKQEGESVAKGEPFLVVETDKVVTEVEAPADGVVLKIVVAPEEERPIGATLAVLGEAGEALSEAELQQLLGAEVASPAAVSAPLRFWSGPSPRRPPIRAERGRTPPTCAPSSPRGSDRSAGARPSCS